MKTKTMALPDNNNTSKEMDLEEEPNSLHLLRCNTLPEISLGFEDSGKDNRRLSVMSMSKKNLDPEANNANKTQSTMRRYLGLTLALASSCAFSLALLTVKLLPKYHPFTFGVWRFAGIFFPSLPILLFYRYGMKKPVFDGVWPLNRLSSWKLGFLLIARGVLGCFASVLQFYAIRYMSLADATVIAFSTPVFVSFVARIFLGEKCGVVPVLTALLALFGVIVISRPPLLTGQQEFNEDNLLGTILAFTAMVFSTFIFVLLRSLRDVHFALVNTTFGFVGITECTIVTLVLSRFELPHSPIEWFIGLSLAVLTFIGISTLTLAFKFEQAGPVALVRTFDVVFAFIWQFIFLGVVPDVFSFLGSLIVISGVILIGVRKGLLALPEDSPNRLRYWFLLK